MKKARKLISACALAIALITPCVSHAEFWDGYQLKEMSDAHDKTETGRAQAVDFYNANSLVGFVVGVYDATTGILFCPSGNAKVGQAVAIVKKYVRENPGKWDMPAATLASNAFVLAFPCKPT